MASQESSRGLNRARRLLRAPIRAWWGSLTLRVVGTTLIGTVLVLALGGWLLQQQAAAGIVKENVAPWPGVLSTRILPWWFSTMLLAIASPRPLP